MSLLSSLSDTVAQYTLLSIQSTRVPGVESSNQGGQRDAIICRDKITQTPVGADLSAKIGINLSLNPGFRRGEGGLVDGLGAFMVARVGGG